MYGVGVWCRAAVQVTNITNLQKKQLVFEHLMEGYNINSNTINFYSSWVHHQKLTRPPKRGLFHKEIYLPTIEFQGTFVNFPRMTLYIEFDHISPTPQNFCKLLVILRNISSIPNYLWPGCFRATDVVSRKFIGIYVYRTCPKRPKPRNIKCLKSLDKVKFQKSIRESSHCFKTQRSHPKKDPPQRIYIQYIYIPGVRETPSKHPVLGPLVVVWRNWAVLVLLLVVR